MNLAGNPSPSAPRHTTNACRQKDHSMTETTGLIAALAAVLGAGGVIIALMRRCAQLDQACRLLLDALVAQRPAEDVPRLRVIQGGRR
jgi:hypothetical protein